MKWPSFCGPSYRAQTMLGANERLMNLYCERIESPGAKNPLVMLPTPGLQTFAEAPESPGRGIYFQSDRCFAVIGTALYELFEDGTKTSRGSVASDQYPATICTNGDGGGQVFITSGDTGYILDLTTNVLTSEVSDVNMGGMIDGYFVALDIATSTLKISDLLDGTAWDPTQVAQRSGQSDPWKALYVLGPIIYLLGELTSEPWYNAGTSPFPFAPVPGAVIPYGIAAPFSVQKLGGSSLVWLAKTEAGVGIVVEAQGYNPNRISTYAVEYAISRYDRIDDAVAFTYQEQGHQFYVLNFPSANATWVYDQTMGLWHERGHWDSEMAEFTEWGPQYHAYAFDQHLVLASDTGTVYTMSADLFTDVDGSLIRRERIPPGIFNEHKRVFLDYFELYCDVGVGLTTGQGSDPQVMLQVSKDGGHTWGPERWQTLGAAGAYGTRVRWNRLGSARDLAIKIAFTDPVPLRMVDAFAGVRAGVH